MVTVAAPNKPDLDMMELLGFNPQLGQQGPQFGQQAQGNPNAAYSTGGGMYSGASAASRPQATAPMAMTKPPLQPNQIPDQAPPKYSAQPNRDINDPYVFLKGYLPSLFNQALGVMNQSPLRSGPQPLYSTNTSRGMIADEANSYWNNALQSATQLAGSRYSANEALKQQTNQQAFTERQGIVGRTYESAMGAMADLQQWVNTFATQMTEKPKKVENPGVLRDAYRKIYDNKKAQAQQMWDMYAQIAGAQTPGIDYFGKAIPSLDANFEMALQGIDFSDNKRGNPR